MLDHQTRALVAQAFQEFSRRNFSAAELLSRHLIDQAPRQPEGYDLLGMVLGSLGHRQKAIDAFQKALILDPKFRPAQENIYSAAAMPDLPKLPPGPRYLVLKSWGFGFWTDVANVLAGLLLAEISQRTPVTHWGSNSRFGDDSGGDAFLHFFEPVSDVTLASLAEGDERAIFPPKWSRENLLMEDKDRWNPSIPRLGGIYYIHRPEPIAVSDHFIGVSDLLPWIPRDHAMHGMPLDEVWRYLVDKYLKPVAALRGAVEAFASQHLNGAVQAVNVPGSEKQLESADVEQANRELHERLATLDAATRILLLTDDARSVEEYRARYGERLLLPSEARAAVAVGDDRVTMGRESVVDAYLAMRCSSFLGHGGSYVSAMISVLKNWPPQACTILGAHAFNQRNAYVYLDQA